MEFGYSHLLFTVYDWSNYSVSYTVMMKRVFFLILLFILGGCESNSDQESTNSPSDPKDGNGKMFPYGAHKVYWNWESKFSKKEQEKLKNWIHEVIMATNKTLGNYPFDLYVHFHRAKRDNQAVSFGHTSRGKQQAVHFYVTPSYSLGDFLSDWKAPHEISHLSLPFVGDQNSWFSEGYATYMSRKIMIEMGYYTATEFDSIYRENIAETKLHYGSVTSTFAEVSDSLLDEHCYSIMYWGSASFFYTADKKLQQEYNTDLVSVIRAYQACCRLQDDKLEDVIHSLDKIAEADIFTKLLSDYRSKPSIEVMKEF